MSGFSAVRVVGAGLAGLAAAVDCAGAGLPVAISEAGPRAGGRCRSYFDPALGLTIDNGNHLVLAGNGAVARFRAKIGADTPLAGPAEASFAFADLRDGTSWRLRLNDGRLPWWVLRANRRVPGTKAADYLPLARLLSARPAQRIGDLVAPEGAVWEKMLAPVLVSVLNTDPAGASALLAANVLRETLGRGGKASAPRIAAPDLASAFVDPAVAWLAGRGAPLATGRRLRALEFSGEHVSALHWADGSEAIPPDAAVVLAVPAWVAGALVPDLTVPTEHTAILNLHYACAPPPEMPLMLGLIGGTAEWIFAHIDDNGVGRLSVTVSAADRLIGAPREDLARLIWGDVAKALRLDPGAMPRWQVVKEKRATFRATPDQDALRPPTHTRWRNLFLAGDYVQNGLPATIEGALRSGEAAARLVLQGGSR